MNPIDSRWAWQAWRPSGQEPWNLKRAGHLYRRAGFGASLADLRESVRIGQDQTMARLLDASEDRAEGEVWASLTRAIRDVNNGEQLSAVWLYRMIHTRQPLREKMTLFWHNHFATSNRKVRNAGYMLGQYALLRRHALGSFADLLQEMSADPAMLVWLDNQQSTKQKPNENYARELMELFSLGIAHPRRDNQRNYTEEDIREAARAFTGWRVENGRGVFQADLHDTTPKTVMGQRGAWQARDVVRICLEQEAAPYFVTRKLVRYFVSDSMTLDANLIEPLANEYAKDWNTSKLVERILRSNLFFSPQAYRAKVKSPIEYAIGIARGLEGHRPEGSGRRLGATELSQSLEALGQRLFYPPSVAGWDGGRAWLNAQTYLLRHNLALALTSTTDDRFGKQLDPAALAKRHELVDDQAVVNFFVDTFHQGDVPAESRDRLVKYLHDSKQQTIPVYWTAEDAQAQRIRAVCHLVLTLPEFQLS